MTLLEDEPFIMPFQDEPFNGDTFACQKFIELRDRFNITTAIELGSAVGGTTKWLCENFQKVVAIEINEIYLGFTKQRVWNHLNVKTILGNTVDHLAKVLETCDNYTILHIDSHWSSDNPLLQELQIIAESGLKPVIEIHDFLVPNHPELGFDTYGEITYEWAWIEKSIQSIYGIDNFEIEYNSDAVGAKRGMVFIYPK